MRKWVSIVVIASSLLSGCGKFKRDLSSVGHTVVNFASARAVEHNLANEFFGFDALLGIRSDDLVRAMTPVDGGLVIYATNVANPGLGGQKILTSPGQGLSLNWVIPNGDYRFYVVGWGASNMDGTPGCGIANGGHPVGLRGGSAEIHIQTGSCEQQNFLNPGASTGGLVTAANFEIHYCDDTEATIGSKTAADSCTTPMSSAQAMRIKIYEFDHFGEPGALPYLESPSLSTGTCHPFVVTGGRFVPNIHPMQGAALFGIRPNISLSFYTTTCATAIDHAYLEFGMAAAGTASGLGPTVRWYSQALATPEDGQWAYDSGTGAGRLFLREAVP